MPPAPPPSVYGFEVRTVEPLRFLRAGGGSETLDVTVATAPAARPSGDPLGEWPLHGAATPARAALYEMPDGFEYWTSDAGRFGIDLEHGRIEIPAGGEPILREQRLHSMPMLLSFAARGDFSLHAAAVEVGTGAVILAAPSRFGKSTLAMAFHRHGYRMLSEDLVCCRPHSLSVIPGPTLLRVRPDVYPGAPPSGMHEVAVRPDRAFLALDPVRRGSCASVPISAILFLREAEELRLCAAERHDAVKDLWHLGFRLPTSAARAESFRQLTRLASAVPAWDLFRPLRADAADSVVSLVVSATGQ